METINISGRDLLTILSLLHKELVEVSQNQHYSLEYWEEIENLEIKLDDVTKSMTSENLKFINVDIIVNNI